MPPPPTKIKLSRKKIGQWKPQMFCTIVNRGPRIQECKECQVLHQIALEKKKWNSVKPLPMIDKSIFMFIVFLLCFRLYWVILVKRVYKNHLPQKYNTIFDADIKLALFFLQLLVVCVNFFFFFSFCSQFDELVIVTEIDCRNYKDKNQCENKRNATDRQTHKFIALKYG